MKKIIILLLSLVIGVFCYAQQLVCYKIGMLNRGKVALDLGENIRLMPGQMIKKDSCAILIYFSKNEIYIHNEAESKYTLIGVGEEKETQESFSVTYPATDEDDVNCTVKFTNWKKDKLNSISVGYTNLLIMYFVKKYKE